jgi:predicted nucleic acid-binding protein
MSTLLDTNILLRLSAPVTPEYGLVISAVQKLLAKSEQLYITPQVLVEFWTVATRPTTSNGGFGWALPHTEAAIDGLLKQFELLKENEHIFNKWREIVKDGVSGKHTHDARIAAVMKTHGIVQILTLNKADFVSFAGISPIHPNEVPT